MRTIRLLSLLSAFLGLTRAQLKTSNENGSPKPRPNIVFILTDDQDIHLHSLDYLPLIKKHLLNEGTYYDNHYCTIAICCPSRVSLWTGKAAHNTNVTDVSPPYGGYPKFISQGLNGNFLPVWLQAAGYNTYYTGKLFNAHTVDNYNSPFVNGFTSSDFLLDPYTYQYTNSSTQRDHDPPTYHPGEYSTDILASKTYAYIDEAAASQKPFFLVSAPIAPHSGGEPPLFKAPISAERHKHLFQNVTVPRTANFNPEVPSGAAWVKKLRRQSQSNVDYNDEFYRQRLRALQAVDEMVDGIFERLVKHGLLENTYVIYSSDNGFHIGQHRLPPGKTCAYEEDINVPLIIRGPGVSKNRMTDVVTTHTDLAPTILHLIGAAPRPDFDGSPIPVHGEEIDLVKTQNKLPEHVNVEFWGLGVREGDYFGFGLNNTYKSVRVIGGNGGKGGKYSLSYTVWCNGDHELYDMVTDEGQMDNLLLTSTSTKAAIEGLGSVESVAARLDALLLVLKSCKGVVCVKPWTALHPGGGVENLKDALAEKFDAFYLKEQVKVKYSRCEMGYILDAEGPQFEKNGLLYRDGVIWSEWV